MEERTALSLEEAAASIGVSVPTMREIANSEGFPAIRKGRRWIIPCSALTQWLDAQARERAVLPGREA